MSQRRPGLGRYVGEPPGQTLRTVRYPFTAETSTRDARFWPQDGAWLDQGMNGTCVAFASAHRIADAPVKTEGVTDRWAEDLYVDATGDETMQEGTYAAVVAGELRSRGLISRFEWIDSGEALDYAVKEHGSVLVGIPWYESMFDVVQGEDGKGWVFVNRASGLAGGHEILINGVRTAGYTWRPFYRLKNSWGRGWGNDGTARIGVKALHRLIFEEWGDAMVLQEGS